MSAYFTQHHFTPHLPPFLHHGASPPVVVPAAGTITTPLAAAPPAPAALSPTSTTTSHPSSAGTPSQNQHHYISIEHLGHFLSAFATTQPHVHSPHPPTIHPAFDLAETAGAYTIVGELPGLGGDDVVVEANDSLCSLTVSGELKRPEPARAVVAEVPQKAPKHETGEVGVLHRESSKGSGKEGGGGAEAKPEKTPVVPAEGATKAAEGSEPAKEPAAEAAGDKAPVYHVSERRVGVFHRVFHLPSERADMAGVHAAMHHGLLTIVVPKFDEATAKARKEAIEEAEPLNRRVRIIASGFTALAPGMIIL